MDNTIYTALTRQSGLANEMRQVANNMANMSTTGYRGEGVIFSEFVKRLGDGAPSLSMALGNTRMTSQLQGSVERSGGALDFAVEGDGFFLLETNDGLALTRAGHFTTNVAGELVTPDGERVLDEGQMPIFIPPDAKISVGRDGTISADDAPLGRLGLFTAAAPGDMTRRNGTVFALEGEPIPVENPVISQGFLEGSNVNPILQMARMIEVQRAYEMGQTLHDQEDRRIRSVLTTLSQ